MNLDPNICYRAAVSRDPRFDGKFYIGVVTTGIYCRPICPAPTAKKENMTFHVSAAAASDAGFRPCLRCFPEYSPSYEGTPSHSQLVARALRLIRNGVVDDCGVSGLADQLDVSERHLRRLFADNLGTSPTAVAQTRRILFAKRLIRDTRLNLTQIAFASGFPSIRQFNGVFKKVFGRSPGSFRNGNRGSTTPEDSRLKLQLGYRPPFNWNALLQFLKPRLCGGIEEVTQGIYRRCIVVDEVCGIIEISNQLNKHQLSVSIPHAFWPHIQWIVDRVTGLFDLGADPLSISSHLRNDPTLQRLGNSDWGLRVPGCWDPFELSIRTILGQQVSVVGATTLCNRLIERWGKTAGQGSLNRQFPTPRTLSRAKVEAIGLPNSRADTIRCFSTAYTKNKIDFDGTSEIDSVIQSMTSVKGIGPWTANYIAMRAFNEPDLYPPGDLGIRKALEMLDGTESWTPGKVRNQAERWRPWRSYAVMSLWNSLSDASSTQ